jgi:CspA family cold shock protein
MEKGMALGRVKWFDPNKGFGFIVNEDGMDVFVHYTEISQEGFRCLRTGQEVEFKLVDSEKGMQGKSVRIISEEDASTKSESAMD